MPLLTELSLHNSLDGQAHTAVFDYEDENEGEED